MSNSIAYYIFCAEALWSCYLTKQTTQVAKRNKYLTVEELKLLLYRMSKVCPQCFLGALPARWLWPAGIWKATLLGTIDKALR